MLVVAAVLGSGAAFGQSCNGIQVLECGITDEKRLNVCIRDQTATYVYGPAAAPELSLTLPLAKVEARPWAGVGRSIWEEIIFPNNGFRYAVWVSIDRMAEQGGQDGGVVVSKGDRQLADLRCQPGTVSTTAFAISDGFAAAGYCWHADTHRWHTSCPE